MNVLFVYKGPTNPIVEAQFHSVLIRGCNVFKFPLKICGLLSYVKEYFRLLFFLSRNDVDVIHAHYSYSGIICGLTFKPTICSLMGSDVFSQRRLLLWMTYFFSSFVWKATIVKSQGMKRVFSSSVVIPNGVDIGLFRPLDRCEALRKTGLRSNQKNVIFVVEKFERNSKNFEVAKRAFRDHLHSSDISLVLVTDRAHSDLPYYYNAADVFLLTSSSEGSPNTVKEAMACNCPIVSTDVGDVESVIGDTEGCYLTNLEPRNIADKIEQALKFGKRTKGRERVRQLGLDTESIADRLVTVYENVCKGQNRIMMIRSEIKNDNQS